MGIARIGVEEKGIKNLYAPLKKFYNFIKILGERFA